MKDGRKHVVIGIPARDYNVSTGVVGFIAQMFHLAARPDCPYAFSLIVVTFQTPTETARNEVVKQFLAIEDADVLWFVDSDAYPCAGSERVLGLLERADVDIAGVMTPFMTGLNDKAFQYNIYSWNEERQAFNPLLPKADSGAIQVDGMGTPGMAIKRHVLEDKRMWFGERDPHYGGDCPPVFRWVRATTGHTIMTDDLDFCIRAGQLGYKLWADTSLRWGHIKQIDVMRALDIASNAHEQGLQKVTHG